MREIISVIGLVFELCGAFLLAARGIGITTLRRIPCTGRRSVGTALVLSFGVTVFAALASFHLRPLPIWPVVLWLGALLVFLAWLPPLAKHAINFANDIDLRRTDEEIERLHLHGLTLIAIGFAIQALGAVLP